jgi:hypothetical protein
MALARMRPDHAELSVRHVGYPVYQGSTVFQDEIEEIKRLFYDG